MKKPHTYLWKKDNYPIPFIKNPDVSGTLCLLVLTFQNTPILISQITKYAPAAAKIPITAVLTAPSMPDNPKELLLRNPNMYRQQIEIVIDHFNPMYAPAVHI